METKPEDSFDDDLDAILNAGAGPSPSVTQPASGANPNPGQSWKAAGREWNDPSELAKAHDHAVRELSRTKNQYKEAQEWHEYGKWLQSNPEALRETRAVFQKYINAGKSPEVAAQKAVEATLPSDVQEQLDMQSDFIEELRLDREVNRLRTQHNATDDEIRAAIQYSIDNEGMNLEQAFKLTHYDNKISATRQAALEKGAQEAARKKAANVGPSSAHSVKPSEKDPLSKSNVERRQALSDKLSKYGFED